MGVITTGCSGFAEVLIEGVPPAMCVAGLYTVNPELCSPWYWLTSNPAFKDLLKFAVEHDCEVVVQAAPTYYKILLREAKKTRHVKETYQALDSPSGIRWLMEKLTGY